MVSEKEGKLNYRWRLIGGILALAILVFGAVGWADVPLPHPVYVHVQNGSGVSPDNGDLTFEAWLTKAPAAVLTQSSFDCDYGGFIPGYCTVNCGNFGIEWTAGDVVHIEVEQTSTGDVGTGEFTLNNENLQFFPYPSGIIIGPIPSPSEVWVDDDYTSASCGAHTWGYDAFVTIQEGIDAVSGSTVNVAAGTYPEYIHITTDNLTVQGAGIDQSIIDLDGLLPYWHYPGNGSYASRAGVLISGYGSPDEIAEGVTFKGFTVKNAGLNPPTPYTEYIDIYADGQDDVRGIGVHNGKDILIQNCKVENSGGPGISVGKARLTTLVQSEDVTITSCVSINNSESGISVGSYVGAISITNNTSSNNKRPHPDADREFSGKGIEISGRNSSNLISGLISGNTCSDNGYQGIVLKNYSDGVVIENNTITGHSFDQDGAGIFFYGKSSNPAYDQNHIIRNNTVTGNIRGIVAYYAQNCTIEGNTITTDSGVFPVGQGGIKLDGANNMLVQNNTLSSLDGIGIKVQNTWNHVKAYDNTITGNTITGAQFAGIPIWGGAHDNTFEYNTITGTTELTFWSGQAYEETQADGVFIDDDAGTSNVFHYNSIHGNAGDGMENQIATEIDAENNNWGSPTGPYHPTLNPTGLGDSVSDNVDFEPWFGAETGSVVVDPDVAPGDPPVENPDAGVSVTIESGTGSTAVTIAEYSSPPPDTPSFGAGATYMDVQISNPGNVTQLSITFENMTASTVIYFYLPGTGWIACSNQTYASGTITVTVTDSTVPTLAQLTGTIFAGGSALGNVNGDSVIDVLDVRLCLQIATGFIEGTGAQRASADVDGDGDVDLTDAQILAEYIIGIRTALPGGGSV